MAVTKGQLLEFAQIQPAFDPVILSDGSATGKWVSLKHYDRVLIKVVATNPTTTGDTIAMTIQQSKDSTGTSAKALNPKKVYEKESTADFKGSTEGTWVASTATLGGTGTTGSTFAGSGNQKRGIWAFDLGSEELDVDNDFDFVRIKIAQTDETTSVIRAYGEYILYNAKYPNETTNMISVLS